VTDPNRAFFEEVIDLLAPVLDDLVFVGGCTTGLFITDMAAVGIRVRSAVGRDPPYGGDALSPGRPTAALRRTLRAAA